MLNLTRSFAYDKNGDAMVIIRKDKPVYPHIIQLDKPKKQDPCFIIFHNDAWKFSSEHNDQFEESMKQLCRTMCDLFDLGDYTTQKYAQICMFVEDSLEPLLEVKPQISEKVTLGEVKVSSRPVGEDGTETFVNDFVVDRPISYEESNG